MVNIKRVSIGLVLLVFVMLFSSCSSYYGKGYQSQTSSKKYDLISIKKEQIETKNVIGVIVDVDNIIRFCYQKNDGTIEETTWSQSYDGRGSSEMIKMTLLSDAETAPYVVLTYSGEKIIAYDFYLNKEMFQEMETQN